MKLTDFVFLFAIFGRAFSDYRDCEPPIHLENDHAVLPSNAQHYPHRSVLILRCELGYMGRLRYMCDDGEWKNTNTRIYCKLKSCGSPGDIPYATFKLVRGDDLVFGAKIEYTCDEGYQMVGRRNYRNCEISGWSALSAECEVKTCSPVKEPENGKIIVLGMFDHEQYFPFGSVLQFECNSPELELQGAKEIYCLSNKTWSDPVPQCKEMTCKKPTIINGRVLSTKGVFKNQQRLEYECNRNLRPTGRRYTTCTKFGWTPIPICSIITCRITSIQNGNFQSEMRPYKYNETTHYTCKGNYKPSGSNKIECKETGWVPTPSCTGKICILPNIDANFYPQLRSFRVGSYVDYQCRADRHRGRSTCTADDWSPNMQCFGSCSQPTAIDNGYLHHPKHTYSNGEKVQYRCNHPFTLHGAKEIECFNGQWFIRDSSPACIAPGCLKPPAIRNGRFNPDRERYDQTEWLRYSCDPGFEIYGKADVQCDSNGWPEAPICNDLNSECTAAPEVNNAEIIAERNHLVHYVCNSGYKIEGSSAVTCVNGNWSLAPTCNRPPDPSRNCDRPPAIESGDTISLTQYTYKHGAKVTYQCQDFYVLNGESEVVCSGGKWSTPPQCIAPCIITEEDFRNNPIRLKWRLHKKLDVKHKDRLEFTCPDGFQMDNNAIQYCMHGRLEVPKCINNERTLCTALQYFECPSCASGEICVEYHAQRISTSRPDPNTLRLEAASGEGNALFTVQKGRERNSNILKFSVKESNNAIMNIRFSTEPRSIRYDNLATGEYCLTFPTDNFIIFNVTFSGNFIIRFDRISQNRG